MGASASQTMKPGFQPGFLITLDALGTLYRFREPITTQYLKVAVNHGLKARIDPKDLSGAFKQSYKSMSSEFPNYGKGQLASPQAWWKTLTEDAFRQVAKESEIPPGLGDALYQHFSSGAAYELYPDVEEFFNTVRQLRLPWLDLLSGCPIYVGVITNSDPRVKAILESLGISIGVHQALGHRSVTDLWEKDHPLSGQGEGPMLEQAMMDLGMSKDIELLWTSYEADFEKPDKRIFTTAAFMTAHISQSRHHVMAAALRGAYRSTDIEWTSGWDRFEQAMKFTMIHIGDDYEKDYKGAQGAGWEALHLVRPGEGKAIEGANTVESLTEAATIIQVMVNESFSKYLAENPHAI